MNPTLTNLSQTIETFLSEVVSANAAVFKQANDERIEMVDLLARMQVTHNTIVDMGILYSKVAATFGELSDNCIDMADKIEDSMDNPSEFCPTCSYEELKGFCDDCGCEIKCTDGYEEDEDGVGIICATCASPADTKVDD